MAARLGRLEEPVGLWPTGFLFNLGIPVRIDAKHAIAHNKIMVIDGETVITGSFNFTKAAEEHNAENLLVIRDAELVEKYVANWKAHAEHSEPYEGKEKGYSETVHGDQQAPAAAAVADGFVASKNSQVFHKAAANRRRRFRPKTSSGTPHGMRRSRPGRSRAMNVIHRSVLAN